MLSYIADSSAVKIDERILPQHQSAITILTTMLQNPNQNEIRWLDLACGKGQIILHISENISYKSIREKITYVGFDINYEYTRLARRELVNKGLKFYEFHHGDLVDFPKIVPSDDRYDFITCTNTAHEIKPEVFSMLIIESLFRLTESGILFIHDMESLEPPELGALTWHGDEVGLLLNVIFEVLGIDYRVYPNVWKHSNCNSWTVIIQRQFIKIENEDIMIKLREINERLYEKRKEILKKRLDNCNNELEDLSLNGTEKDERRKTYLTSEFWQISREAGIRFY